MKLIIDIPDTTYTFVKQLQGLYIGRGNCKTVQQTVINAIKFGKPQPQGKWKPKLVAFGTCTLQGFECDCGRIVMQRENFCPDCGAQMGVIGNEVSIP